MPIRDDFSFVIQVILFAGGFFSGVIFMTYMTLRKLDPRAHARFYAVFVARTIASALGILLSKGAWLIPDLKSASVHPQGPSFTYPPVLAQLLSVLQALVFASDHQPF